MTPTIHVSQDLFKTLRKMKRDTQDRYEDILWDILEDRMELSAQTRQNLRNAREDVKKGKTYTLKEVKKRIGLGQFLFRYL